MYVIDERTGRKRRFRGERPLWSHAAFRALFCTGPGRASSPLIDMTGQPEVQEPKRQFPPLYRSSGDSSSDRLAFFHILERLKVSWRFYRFAADRLHPFLR